ncbi:urea carboxylase-associated family protein [Paraferrimonas sp. SM1919]|uniref:DUF1989 domain-containing protein n=1 Tax=Paraferrimonas sp. SM1919 TaxID=2662263 RepID=UPI0013D774FD|nr:urea carboxylase-associated family protein [Paraferrimonas sp. SM1919]
MSTVQKKMQRDSGMLMGTAIDPKYHQLTEQREQFTLVEQGHIAARSGKGFVVKAGQVFRIIQAEGPQIGDVWLFNKNNPKEHFMGHTTFLYEGAYLSQYSQLWSCMPHVRPMATVLVEHSGEPELPDNFRNHVVLGGHCTEAQWEMLSGVKGHPSCHANGMSAVAPFGLTEADIIHDNFMVFQPSFIQPDGSGDSVNTRSNPGDYVEFVAEMDLIVAVSACPVGDYAVPMTEPENITARALAYEIYDV